MTLSAVLAGDVTVFVTSLVGFAGTTPPDVVLPAIAEVASLADCVGWTSPTDHAEVLTLAVAEVASSADIAGAASSAVAGVASSAVAGAASSAVIVEVASSTDSMSFVDSPRTFGVNRENDSLVPDDCIDDCGTWLKWLHGRSRI